MPGPSTHYRICHGFTLQTHYSASYSSLQIPQIWCLFLGQAWLPATECLCGVSCADSVPVSACISTIGTIIVTAAGDGRHGPPSTGTCPRSLAGWWVLPLLCLLCLPEKWAIASGSLVPAGMPDCFLPAPGSQAGACWSARDVSLEFASRFSLLSWTLLEKRTAYFLLTIKVLVWMSSSDTLIMVIASIHCVPTEH